MLESLGFFGSLEVCGGKKAPYLQEAVRSTV